MKFLKTAVRISGVVVLLAACSNGHGKVEESATPGRRHFLTERQIEVEATKASKGDKAAVTRLVNHYQWAVSDGVRAEYWLRKGSDIGDHYSMINLSSLIAVRADEKDCKEAERLLIRVLEEKPDRETRVIAENDLSTLRNGVGDKGYCTTWL